MPRAMLRAASAATCSQSSVAQPAHRVAGRHQPHVLAAQGQVPRHPPPARSAPPDPPRAAGSPRPPRTCATVTPSGCSSSGAVPRSSSPAYDLAQRTQLPQRRRAQPLLAPALRDEHVHHRLAELRREQPGMPEPARHAPALRRLARAGRPCDQSICTDLPRPPRESEAQWPLASVVHRDERAPGCTRPPPSRAAPASSAAR